MKLQIVLKTFQRQFLPLHMNDHPFIGIHHPSRQVVPCGNAENKRPETDPLHTAMHNDGFCYETIAYQHSDKVEELQK